MLDIIDLPLVTHTPHAYQTENWRVGAGAWKKAGFFQASQLPLLGDRPQQLWPTGHHTQLGHNDRVPEAQAAQERVSLCLVQVRDLQLVVSDNPFKQKRQVHGRFSYNGLEYACKVTDPVIERNYLAIGLGNHALGDCYLTLSLGEPFQGYVYKLIAAVFL